MRFTTDYKLAQSVHYNLKYFFEQFKKYSLSILSAEWIPVKALLNRIAIGQKNC